MGAALAVVAGLVGIAAGTAAAGTNPTPSQCLPTFQDLASDGTATSTSMPAGGPSQTPMVVPAGTTVDVTITWTASDFVSVDQLLDCVRTGVADPQPPLPPNQRTDRDVPALSDLEAPISNSGTFSRSWTIPTDAAPGSYYCERAAVVGTAADGSSLSDKTKRVCFQVQPGVPSVPTGVVATPGDGGADVTWSEGSNDGSPITQFTVLVCPGGDCSTATRTVTSSGTGTSSSITGLTNGTAYGFEVSATNGVGNSAYSAESNVVTPSAATPPAPTGTGSGQSTLPNRGVVARLAGPDRIGTAVAVSKDSYPSGRASAVVLARSDDYPDALAAVPFAAMADGPMLLTPPTELDPRTLSEVQRVLAPGGKVYVMGGPAAISDDIAGALVAAGYPVTRIGGADRFDTAVQLAQAMGDRPVVFLTTGLDFPDALSAGPAAAQAQGAVLFTDGDKRNKTTDAYLQPFVVVTQYAVGGQAASAYPKATALVGDDRYGTNAAVASRFFPTSANVGLATGAAFPDGLTGGASVAKRGGPVLLTDPSTLTSQAQGYLAADKGTLVLLDVFGGPEAVTDAVYQAAVQSQL